MGEPWIRGDTTWSQRELDMRECLLGKSQPWKLDSE